MAADTRAAGRFNQPAQGSRLVAAEIVHDDDITGFEDGQELLLDVGAETLAVDRAVEDARRGEPVAAQRAEEGQRPPAAVWREASQAFAFRPPAAHWGHVGLDPGLIDEDQPPRIETGLPGSPASAPVRDIGAGLLKGEQCFF